MMMIGDDDDDGNSSMKYLWKWLWSAKLEQTMVGAHQQF